MEKHTISVLVENKFGVLARVAGMFSGRGFNIDSLNVGPTHEREFSRITATIIGDEAALDQALKQLNKLVNVISVDHYHGNQAVRRELILLKVGVGPDKRAEVAQICDIFRAKIIDVAVDSVVIEMTGNDNKVRAFLNLMDPYLILELARTGPVALARGQEP